MRSTADDCQQPSSKGKKPVLKIRIKLPPTEKHSSLDKQPLDDFTLSEPFEGKSAADEVYFFSITEDKNELAQQPLPSSLNMVSKFPDMPINSLNSLLQQTECKILPSKRKAHHERKSSNNPRGSSRRRTSDKALVRNRREGGPSNPEGTGIDQDPKTEELPTENNLDKTTTASNGMQDYFHPDINLSAITFRDLELLQDPDLWLITFNDR